jgi:hypothetical protein
VEDFTATVNKQARKANVAVEDYEGTLDITDECAMFDNALDQYNGVITQMNGGIQPPPYEKAKEVWLADTAKAVVQKNKDKEDSLRKRRSKNG